MNFKISKNQWRLIGEKTGWIKQAQIIPDDGYADGGEPYTDEEMDQMDKEDNDKVKVLSFSFGTTPPEIISKRTKEQAPSGYPMTIRDQENWAVIVLAVNQGIDSYLEGFTRSTFDHKTGKCLIHPEEMNIFLRRLSEQENEAADNLRSSILSTLEIEEI